MSGSVRKSAIISFVLIYLTLMSPEATLSSMKKCASDVDVTVTRRRLEGAALLMPCVLAYYIKLDSYIQRFA